MNLIYFLAALGTISLIVIFIALCLAIEETLNEKPNYKDEHDTK